MNDKPTTGSKTKKRSPEPYRTKQEQEALKDEILAQVQAANERAVWQDTREFEIPGHDPEKHIHVAYFPFGDNFSWALSRRDETKYDSRQPSGQAVSFASLLRDIEPYGIVTAAKEREMVSTVAKARREANIPTQYEIARDPKIPKPRNEARPPVMHIQCSPTTGDYEVTIRPVAGQQYIKKDAKTVDELRAWGERRFPISEHVEKCLVEDRRFFRERLGLVPEQTPHYEESMKDDHKSEKFRQSRQ